MKTALATTALLSFVLVGSAQTSGDSTNKVDIKELLALPAFTNSTGIVMVQVAPTLWAGKYLVTQTDYQAVTGGNPSRFSGARNPVDSVSYNDALRFCQQLTRKETANEMVPPGFEYTLPTQTQWEMLMDAATLDDAVTSVKGDRRGSAPVGTLSPNRLGLYDIRGNVWEFCLDPQDKPYRVLRGGAWDTSIEINLRPEFRWYANGPDDRKNVYGFRVVLGPAK